MIIYNKTWLANLIIHEQVQQDLSSGTLSSEEVKNIEKAYPVGFYSPNIFVRIGLFLLANVIVSFSGGLFALFVSDLRFIAPEVWLLAAGIACYFGLETIVKQSHHYRSGADDALLWLSGGMVFGALNLLTEPVLNNYKDTIFMMFNAGFLFGIGLFLSLRFADRLMSVLTFLAFVGCIGFFWISAVSFGTATLPLLVMILSASAYFYFSKKMTSLNAVYYLHCLKFLRVASLLVLYLAGNYFIVKQLGTQLLAADGVYEVPLPYLFWTWTFVIPFVYIFYGIRKRDMILLRSGLILVAAAGFTFRNYYHVMPAELTLVIIGLILLAASYAIIRYLKTPKYGITYEDLNQGGLSDQLKIESLIVAEMPTGAEIPQENRFGGGSLGGGGASGTF